MIEFGRNYPRRVHGAIGGLVILVSISAWADDARADFPIQKVIMQCDAPRNRMLLRFGTLDAKDLPPDSPVTLDQFSYGVNQIPTYLLKSWSNVDYRIAGHCKLQNGQIATITVEYGKNSSSHPVPNAYFSMTIDRHSVYSGRMFSDETSLQERRDDLGAIEYDSRKLLECGVTDSTRPVTVASSCHDESVRLSPGYRHLPAIERLMLQKAELKRQLESALSPFCRALHALPPGAIADHFARRQFPDALYIPENQKFQTIDTDKGEHIGIATITMVDIYNNGLPVAVMDILGDNVLFRGNFLVVFPVQGEEPQAFIADIEKGLRQLC